MCGIIIDQGQARQADIVYTGRALDDDGAVAKFEAYHAACLAHEVSRRVPLGRGQIVTQSARKAKTFLAEQLEQSPYLLTVRNTQ
jgi:hypothetical protein